MFLKRISTLAVAVAALTMAVELQAQSGSRSAPTIAPQSAPSFSPGSGTRSVVPRSVVPRSVAPSTQLRSVVPSQSFVSPSQPTTTFSAPQSSGFVTSNSYSAGCGGGSTTVYSQSCCSPTYYRSTPSYGRRFIGFRRSRGCY